MPEISIILATHNRRDVVRNTLENLGRSGLAPDACEIIVVDNHSTDGTREFLETRRDVRLIALPENCGACAKGRGVNVARAPLVLFLDDDSYPQPGFLERVQNAFTHDPRLGAAAFRARLPDGREECSALPHVFVGCGAAFRAAALREVGGVDESFFMAAEEYDLSFRLLGAGWGVEAFADLVVEHLKSPHARRSERISYYDIRNNLRVIARYLPDEVAAIYRADWLLRYRWLAERVGHESAHERGVSQGTWDGVLECWRFRRQRLSAEALEQVLSWRMIDRHMLALRQQGVRKIVLADWGKNAYAFLRGAIVAGVQVLAIGDDRFAAPGRTYRELPILPLDDALALGPDAVVVGNTSYVHAHERWLDLSRRTSRPAYNWFEPPTRITEQAPTPTPTPVPASGTT